MRWKSEGINYCSGSSKVIGLDNRLCIYDNGTTICSKGHRISSVGICRSQSVGKVNSTDETFQPTYSICTSNYLGKSDSIHVLNVGTEVSGDFVVYATITCSGIVFTEKKSSAATKQDYVRIKSLEKTGYDSYFYVLDNYIADYSHVYHDTNYKSTIQKVLQLDSGAVSRITGSYSDWYSLDVYGYAAIVLPYFYTIKKQKDVIFNIIDPVYGSAHTLSSGVGISTPSLYGENPADICVGDQISPVLDNVEPQEDSVLVKQDEPITFDITDAIGGVKLSSLYITVSGSETLQDGGTSIVEAGVVQVPSYASLEGTQTRYSFEYTPPSNWQQNESVYVTITGSDNKPLDEEGEEFTCTGGVNTFYYGWSYKVENTSDFYASITAVADTSAPYLESVSPTPFLGGVNSTDDIVFYIKDDLSGVDLSSLNVYINDIKVVSNGVGVSSVSITGNKNSYYFIYTNTPGFSYGDRVFVRVVADDLYTLSPNNLDYTYYFDIVDDTTVIIDNFYPEEGITWNPELINIEVEVKDFVYDIDISNLYLSINGVPCLASTSPIYGNRDLSSVSGSEYICGLDLDNTYMLGTISGTTISGSDIYGGYVSTGVLSPTGFMGSFPDPFYFTPYSSVISGTVFAGTVSSGTIVSVLSSGVNWDGKYYDSTITGVDVRGLYASSVCASGVVISGTVGQSLSYHPDNDFNYDGYINVLVHGTNYNSVSPVTREVLYQLVHGYNVKSFNRVFKHNSPIDVLINVSNVKDYSNELRYGFYFETVDQKSNDMCASITGIAPWEDITASISPQAPVHMYGKIMEIIVYAKDLEGNELGPYTFYYTIEEGV